MVNDITKLAQEIQDSAIPLWLRDYLAKNRDKMKAELKLFGKYEIPTPDGGVIKIKKNKS